ncbi:pyrroloquinoline quinone biosynthesis protein D [Pseudonocardia hierapolitana]|uniref:Pyrroloquinoline quinone biosynthesis protein D n=1 Tax=Pseudonocardia hierapolitana TaxID=1128676 RepID=A0A561T5K1_9PSEU|nr:pyrroloquinoline quinone biosynthesis peptide chaperone PqqD [Pseudonocardia hierapolitana]TWF82382.1 pyrroloquinoline quinone biosynthesis protein D [Pseudonocardia hierapolitana]
MPSTPPIRTGPTQIDSRDRPRLARHVRLTFDRARERHVLLSPETVVVLNATGTAVLELCDGQRTVTEIVAELGARYSRVVDEEVRGFLDRLLARRCVEVDRDEE